MLFQNSEKIYVCYHFLILVKDSYSLTKFEWEICPKSQFLMQKVKLFQIKRICAKKINNKPWLILVPKVAIHHIYVQYTHYFFFENWRPDQQSEISHKIYVRKCQIKLSETRYQSKEEVAIFVPEYSNFISY